MKTNNFNRLLNKVPFLQYFIGIVPVLLVILFSIVSTFDVMNIYASIEANDSLLDTADIRSITEVDGSKYMYEALDSVEFKASTNSSLFKIYAMNETTVSYEVAGGGILYVKNSPIIGTATIIDDKLQYPKVSKSLIAFGEQIAEVFLLDDGTYEIRYEDYTDKMDSIIGLTTIGKDSKEYSFKLDDSGVVILIDEVFFTSKLETDDFYVDVNQQVVLKNASSDLAKNYILGSKLYLVVLSSIFFLVLVIFAKKQKVLIELSKTVYVWLHSFSCICAILTLLLTILLLS
jgi:hypothetical protein